MNSITITIGIVGTILTLISVVSFYHKKSKEEYKALSKMIDILEIKLLPKLKSLGFNQDFPEIYEILFNIVTDVLFDIKMFEYDLNDDLKNKNKIYETISDVNKNILKDIFNYFKNKREINRMFKNFKTKEFSEILLNNEEIREEYYKIVELDSGCNIKNADNYIHNIMCYDMEKYRELLKSNEDQDIWEEIIESRKPTEEIISELKNIKEKGYFLKWLFK